jgi:diguanylate cyclase (GGDEF)-like protein
MMQAAAGGGSPAVVSALEVVERKAYADDGSETPGTDGASKRQLVRADGDGAHAVAVPLRARFGGEDLQFLGVLSIARDDEPFSEAECDLLAYLAGQATVSLENASLHETVQRQAVTDELTGLYNVRHFHQTLDSEIERARRFTSDVGLVMLDIDDFKQVNDTYGHLQGDLVLREVAKVLHNISREIDEPARYGGEEMAVILPQTALEGAEQSGERMRAAIEGLRIRRLGGGEDLRITASFGVASLPASAGDKGALIAAADAALYRAKRAGKNRVERAEHAPAAR